MNAIPTEADAHTPGPLVVDGFADCQLITKDVPVAMGRPIGIAKVYGPNMIGDARLFGAASELLDALERLAIFHQSTHPLHGDLHEEYAEDCIANEISYSSATLLDSLVRAANAAIAKATGGTA